MNVDVVPSMESHHASNLERPLCKERSASSGGSIVFHEEDSTFHTLIVAPPEEE
jgi:hypothetical protein